MRRIGIAVLLLALLSAAPAAATTPSTEEDTAFVDAFITYWEFENALNPFSEIPGATLSPPTEPECAKQAAADRRADKDQESSGSEVLESSDGRTRVTVQQRTFPTGGLAKVFVKPFAGKGFEKCVEAQMTSPDRGTTSDVEVERQKASVPGADSSFCVVATGSYESATGYMSSFSQHSIVGRRGNVAFKVSVYGPTDTFPPVSDAVHMAAREAVAAAD